MSARKDLLRNLRGYTPCGEDDEADAAAQMLDAFEAQVLREAAEKIRDERPQWGEAWRHWNAAADLIDPDRP